MKSVVLGLKKFFIGKRVTENSIPLTSFEEEPKISVGSEPRRDINKNIFTFLISMQIYVLLAISPLLSSTEKASTFYHKMSACTSWQNHFNDWSSSSFFSYLWHDFDTKLLGDSQKILSVFCVWLSNFLAPNNEVFRKEKVIFHYSVLVFLFCLHRWLFTVSLLAQV